MNDQGNHKGQSRENKGKQGVREVQGVIEGRINEIIKGYSREIGKENEVNDQRNYKRIREEIRNESRDFQGK